MSQSLKDQLLGLGFSAPVSKAPVQSQHNNKKTHAKQPGSKAGSPRNQHKSSVRPKANTETASNEMDLAKAFALRTQHEKRERERIEGEKQAAALLKKQAKEKVVSLLDGQLLNAADADIARHFSYGGKIRRIYVTGEQLPALNAGDLGVVQLNGRFCLVSKEVAMAVREALPALLALYCDGNEEALPEGYDDPKFQVPDDLIW
jgi:uncharacterized protein YaiL (DUF2058 family)